MISLINTSFRSARTLRLSRLLLCIGLLALSNGLMLSVQTAPAEASSSPAALGAQTLAQLNAWRVNYGYWPLKENAILDQIATDQATYVASKIQSVIDSGDESNYHKDAQGRMPIDRDGLAPYLWPNFGTPARITVGENAAVGGSVKFAINFWQNSSIHEKTALNGAYREIGLAVVPVKGLGYLFITEFGARPGVLTTLLNPLTSTLYFSNESAAYTNWEPADTQLRITDSSGNVIADTFPFDKTYKLPSVPTGPLKIQYLNHKTEVDYMLDPTSDIAVLPGVTLPGATPVVGSTAAVPAPTTAAATSPPPSSIIPTNTPLALAVATVQAAATSSIDSTITSTPVLLTSTPAPLAASADLTLNYTTTGLTIRNTSSRVLDLTGFVIGNTIQQVPIGRWTTVSDFPVNAFQPGVCLQNQMIGAIVPDATGCKYVRAVVMLDKNHLYWTSHGPFTVVRNGILLGTCDDKAAVCTIRMP